MSKALAKYEGGGFLVGVDDMAAIMGAVSTALGNKPITPDILTTVGIPAGGGIHFMIPTSTNPEGDPVKEITGVILKSVWERVYWPKSLQDGGAGEEPQCSSEDGLVGVGEPGGDCPTCSLSKPGSSGGRAAACKQYQNLMILQTGKKLLPIIVRLPIMSQFPYEDYIGMLLGDFQFPNKVVTSIQLEQTTNKDNVTYSRATFANAGEMTEGDIARVGEYVSGLMGLGS
jgi:hypothetical protein